ncbi:enoyl-CoA hydratase [Gordonia oryzae]|uniref:Enoyl-CoA hydratase n=2 Tax=Gordonia oryzae TaxID=2487349 RepID=A0A3N4GVL8_9ACTN|nr:enoyl-CoA hydratase [Gordonia oryzae]
MQTAPERLSDTVTTWRDDAVAIVEITRPQKRNALDDATVLTLESFFSALTSEIRAVVLCSEGEHFCAGLDLSQLDERNTFEGVQHSRMWHRALGAIREATVPVFAVLKGAVIGGGLELASSAHVRVAEMSTFYALPEGQHGIFVGGGASVRLPRLIGVDRMIDMMLTGRRYDAVTGERIGLSQYVVDDGAGFDTALELAHSAAKIAPVSTFAVLQALPHIAEAGQREGYLIESLMAGVAQGTDEAKARMQSFLTRNQRPSTNGTPR